MMTLYIKDSEGKWEEGAPSNGDKYLKVKDNVREEGYWYESPEKNKIIISSHNGTSRILVPKGESVSFLIEIKDPLGNTVPLNDTFALPIQRLGGSVERTVGFEFVEGAVAKDVLFNSSGEFLVTEELINMYLPEEAHFSFETFHISVME